MAFLFNDQIHTKSFTPREHQVELFYLARERNIVICLGKTLEKTFIITKLIQDIATNNRRALSSNGKRIVYLLESYELCMNKAKDFEQFTDLKVLLCSDIQYFNSDQLLSNTQILILTTEIFYDLLRYHKILPDYINLIIIDKCHDLVRSHQLNHILNIIRISNKEAKIIGFAAPLYSLTEEPGQLSFEIQRIESLLPCEVETASDLLTVLRYSPKPKEYILAYKIKENSEVENYLQECANITLNFLIDHRYDPTETYSEEFLDDIRKIPDPTVKPCEMIQDFLYILETLGPWAADRAALIFLLIIEKLKIKTPYERHYLLLGLVATLFLKIRAYCDAIFFGLSESEKIFKFSSLKIHRLLEVLKTFRPSKKDKGNNSVTNDIATNKEESKPLKSFKSFQTKRDIVIKKLKSFHCSHGSVDPDFFCGVIFVEKNATAKVLFYLLSELSKSEESFLFLSPLYTSEKINDEYFYGKDLEIQHKKQEEVLKKFRIHECNLLISTAILEEGIEIPKCNFVMRFDFPKNYQSYVQCKNRARAIDALHVLLIPEIEYKKYLEHLGDYHYIEKILLSKCSNKETSELEETEADLYDSLLPEYKPLDDIDAPKVTLNSAISLVNRYCAKLPSDTFTILTPEWKISDIYVQNQKMYICSLRLPINSPLKYPISSYPMPNKALAKRMAALQLCVYLHRESEIDDNLLPVAKETFKANPEDIEVSALPGDEKMIFTEARPGTTKRRQYYYKRIANSLTDCRPQILKSSYLYHINMLLSCPLPEEQNTRGRKIYPPEDSVIGFGILTNKQIPIICPFPIYTRSGEVQVNLKLSKKSVVLDENQIAKVVYFLNYTFTNVLRLQKYLMLFDPNFSENSYIIVPVKRFQGTSDICIDWDFVDCIYMNQNDTPKNLISEEIRSKFRFNPRKYHDAVIMPWYRNEDQPQYFYVAEICYHLNPKSSFPGADYSTFEEYYSKKYSIQIKNLEQPLLDVDHTSARLNFLTPRYVNRKGVALPTSSEETKRAKRENLEQKQILLAELCSIHPFPASLWRQAVCLPCILYRINALLLADEIRCQVAQLVNLGQELINEEFQWPALNFGWCLADVLNKQKEHDQKTTFNLKGSMINKKADSKFSTEEKALSTNAYVDNTLISKLEIGIWSNEMEKISTTDINVDQPIPLNLNIGNIRYGSPTCDLDFEESMLDNSYSDDFEEEYYDTNSLRKAENLDDCLHITYTCENIAEAVDKERNALYIEKEISDFLEQERKSDVTLWNFKNVYNSDLYNEHRMTHLNNIKNNVDLIVSEGLFIPYESSVSFKRINSNISISKINRKYEDYVKDISNNFLKEVVSGSKLSNIQIDDTIPDSIVHYAEGFSFDYQPDLIGHPGPSPSLILQALTMSNANDGINLERLETIGDSFLKYAITTYLFCKYSNIHEGKLSHLRSKQVSNLNLYRLGRRKMLGESMIATKFEPHDNWLPPCYYVPKEFEQLPIESKNCSIVRNAVDIESVHRFSSGKLYMKGNRIQNYIQGDQDDPVKNSDRLPSSIPYNLITQHSIPDKSIADCVEALIGAYLIACGPRGALLFMSWLGIPVLPTEQISLIQNSEPLERPIGSSPYSRSITDNGQTKWLQTRYTYLRKPPSPLFYHVPDPVTELQTLLDGYDLLEKSIGYSFRNKSYLLQAFTHASYQINRLTDCYQRLEFLGDAVLDYLITRHLYEDPRQHSPGALTDLRSALVNNTIFASLAVRCGFQKYFKHLSPGLNIVIDRFVRIQEENGHTISEEYYLIGEKDFDETEEAEDVEVPKALGDVFESLAGAIYLDSNMSLDAVWSVYFNIMKAEIEQFSSNVPKSPIRELLELEPETAKFGKPEKLADGKRVRVTVDVFGKGSFKGIGRNYRIAKCTAAKCALKKLKNSYKII